MEDILSYTPKVDSPSCNLEVGILMEDSLDYIPEVDNLNYILMEDNLNYIPEVDNLEVGSPDYIPEADIHN